MGDSSLNQLKRLVHSRGDHSSVCHVRDVKRFILGNRRTRRAPDQLVTALIVPKPAGRAAGHFLKFGARKYLVISIVMAAATISVHVRLMAGAPAT